MATVYTIALLEGRKPATERLAPILKDEGYRVVSAGTRKTALIKVQASRPAVIVVDTLSLRFDGVRLCSALQDSYPGILVLALLPGGEEADPSPVVNACLRFPFSPKELADRVADLLSVVLQVGDVIYNVEKHSVIYSQGRKHLTPKQGRLLEVLMRHPDQILTRAFLMKRVWDTDYLGDTRTLDVHIRWVRRAIEEDAGSPAYLRTVRGVGYRFGVPQTK